MAEQHRYGSILVPLAQLGAGGPSIAVAALHSTRASLSAEIVSLLKSPRMRAIERLQTHEWPPERSATITPESHAALGRADARANSIQNAGCEAWMTLSPACHQTLRQTQCRSHGRIAVFVMPIGQYLDGEQFDPETARLLGIAFEFAIQALHNWGVVDPPRDAIARAIIGFARAGERDPERLCDLAVEACAKPVISNPSPLPPDAAPPAHADS